MTIVTAQEHKIKPRGKVGICHNANPPQQFPNRAHQRILQWLHPIIILIRHSSPFDLCPPKLQGTTLAVLHIRIIPTMSCSLSIAFSCNQVTAPRCGIGMHGLPIPDSQIFNNIATAAALSCVHPYIQRLEVDPERSFSCLRVYSLGR